MNRLCTLVLAALLLASGPARAIEDDDWIEVRSEHFLIYSNAKAEKAEELAVDLEHFRALVLMLTNTTSATSFLPFKIIAAKSQRDFKKFYDHGNVVGVFSPTIRGHYAVIDMSTRQDTRSGRSVSGATPVLFHEYVHYLLRNNTRVRYPMWYEEGFAEFLATLIYEDGTVTVGSPNIGRARTLFDALWMSVENLLAADLQGVDRRSYRFYAQSWLMVHYLSQDPDLAPGLVKYLTLYSEGVEPMEAFREAFGFPASKLNRRLKRYWKKGRYPVRVIELQEPLSAPEITIKPLDETQARLMLGQFYSDFPLGDEGAARAKDVLAPVVQSDSGGARALSILAAVGLEEGAVEAAGRLLERARALAPSDPFVLTLEGDRHLMRSWHEGADAASEVELARKNYVAALTQDNGAVEALYGLGLTYLGRPGDVGDGIKAFEAAHFLLPTSSSVTLGLATLHLQQGDTETGMALLDEVARWESGDEFRKRVAKLKELALGGRRPALIAYVGRMQAKRFGALPEDAAAE